MEKTERKKIAFYNQGCRLNQAETAVLEQGFQKKNFQVVPISDKSDLVIINTCTVTENGDADTKKLVKRIHRDNPNVKIALIGCQAQILKEQLLKLPGVKWVVGNQQKMDLPNLLSNDIIDKAIPAVWTPKITQDSFTQTYSGVDTKHTRANLKIQDGCNFYCSFCTIPFARGPARSRVFEDILKEANELVLAGHQELVLTGINIGTYEESNKNILDVINELEKIPLLRRIRISSIEPTTIPKEIIKKMKDSEKLCRHLHIPLQAGSNEILKKMNRKYTLEEFDEFIQFAYDTVPDICIGTDVIVGFPGETNTLFDACETYLRNAPIHYFHVFSYSERKMARSKKMPEQVPKKEIDHRSQTLRKLSQRKKNLFLSQFLDQTQPVLFEQEKNGYWWGHTDNYLKIGVLSETTLKNKWVNCKFKTIKGASIIGNKKEDTDKKNIKKRA